MALTAKTLSPFRARVRSGRAMPIIGPAAVRRPPRGAFIEVHQRLGSVDPHGHPERLLYQGTPLPKKMNKLRAAGHPVPGSLLRPDPAEETAALERAWAEDAKRDAEREQRALSAGATEQHAH